MLLLTVFGDHINQITEGLPPSSAISRLVATPSQVDSRGNLNDAEEFVRVMLHVNSTALSTSTVTSHGCNDMPGFNYNGDRESFCSLGGSAVRGGSMSAQRLTSSHSVSPLVRRLFSVDNHGYRHSSAMRQSFVHTPTFTCDPAPQLLRSPPPGYKADFDE
jgi:hypothetical protein